MIAATHATLAAESLGLSTCMMNGWMEDKVKAVIGAENDSDLAIALVLPIGYAAEPRKHPGRMPFEFNRLVAL
jgi:nitroreductase